MDRSTMEPAAKTTSKDLLGLEQKILSASSSLVLDKAKNFLAILADANKRLEHDVKECSSKDYDIETLTGNEDEFIEMDLVLGVADLRTPEAVAAAQSAISGAQPVVSLDPKTDGSDSESSDDAVHDSDENDTDSDGDCNDKTNGKNQIQSMVVVQVNFNQKSDKRLLSFFETISV